MDKKYKFQEVYTFPFKVDKYIDWVYDANDKFIFQFEKENLSIEDKDKIISFLNGEYALKSFLFTKHENGLISISLDNKTFEPFVLIRGYGYLTGIGGLNLSHEEAVEIQNSLAQYILDKIEINNKNNCWLNEKRKISDLKVLKSNAGYYIGTVIEYPDGSYEPYSRESEYFKTKEQALEALADKDFFYIGDSSAKKELK